MRSPFLCLALVSAVLSCSGGSGDDEDGGSIDAAPAGYCDNENPCTDAALPFCDIAGIFPDSSGEPNTCIAEPPIDECSDTIECPDDAAPVCNSLGECVECLNFSHCNTTNPTCALSTYTCGPCRFGEQGDTVCEAIDIFQPFCGESGSCVECLDNSPCGIVTAPICDQVDFSCRGCETTEECDEGTCNTLTGVCEVAG